MARDSHRPAESLAAQHTPEAIAERLRAAVQPSHVGDYVLGAVDGTVTTFAIVAGVAGTGLPGGVALVLGLANVLADGLSMAASNYLKARSDAHVVERRRRLEERHIDAVPEGEREEIRQIFAAKGFDGPLLEEAVAAITRDRRRWVDTMLTEEWGLPLTSPHPGRAALATFVAFLGAGLVPLAPLACEGWLGATRTFISSALAAALTFAVVGAWRGRVAGRSAWRGAGETLLIGGGAAAVAYLVGVALRGLVPGA
jgi:VIT1/CCC1 family predicted Fe2+/Mn2+ transporter